MTSLAEYLVKHQRRMVDDLAEIVMLESPSTDKALLDQAAAWVASRMEDFGGTVSRISAKQGGNICRAEWRGAVDDAPILLLAHFDTVWDAGTTTRRPFVVEGNRARGPGIFDMKAGLVQALWAIRGLQEAGPGIQRPLVFLANADEEIGSPFSRHLIEAEAARSAYVLVFEASQGGAVKTARKGTALYRLTVRGRAAHAGLDPEKGRSAISELADLIRVIERLADPEAGTTVNVGVIRGGTRPNVVAAEAEAEVDIRVANQAEAERIHTAMSHLQPNRQGLHLVVEGGLNRPPMERTPATAALYQRAAAIAKRLGFRLEETAVGGASDGNFCAALGKPVLDGLGAVGDGAHAEHEYVEVDLMPVRAALAAHLMAEL
jgi:glutamate carboxypeptidase